MTSFIEKYADIWGDNPQQLMAEYNYQSALTEQLDTLSPSDFDREKLYEIVLWKLNRFPQLEDDLLEKIRDLSSLTAGSHRASESVLKELLTCHGIRLPMASTILRFINPSIFKIIDDRVFRVLNLEGKIPVKPTKVHEKYLQKCCDVYFNYLDELHKVCDDSLPFEESDRILYLLDIKLGNKIGD